MIVNLIIFCYLTVQIEGLGAGTLFFSPEKPEECDLPNGTKGICTIFKNCLNARDLIRSGQRPITCGFKKIEPIICCQEEAYAFQDFKAEKVGDKSRRFCNDTHYTPPGFYGVFNGREALAGEFPHMAALGFGEPNQINWACGGSLISWKFVITAAHCISTELGPVKFVRLGDLDLKLTTDESDVQNFTVIKTYVHPDRRPFSKYHDIAIIELDRYAYRSNYVKPTCLHIHKDVITENSLSVTGWGGISFGGPAAGHLQALDNVLEFKYADCKIHYKSEKYLKEGIKDESQICAGKENGDTCQGDSGGPLQFRSSKYIKTYELVGITSFGKACGISKSPGVYTRISNYIDWIENIVWPNYY